MRAWLRSIEGRDIIVTISLALVGAGCWQVSPALGLAAPGLLLFGLVVWAETIRQKKTGGS